MSTRHLFPSAAGLVNKSLRGHIAYNPSLSLDEPNRVVFDTSHPPSQVSLISGGGSGHEPAWAGYVGANMLAASVAGDIFASPSTKQILSAISRVPSDKGSILVVTNYTGDCLHFGLAHEKNLAAGNKNSRIIICGDDVSVGKTPSGLMVGRRGLAGQIGVLKAMGGAAGSGGSLDDVYDLGVALERQIVSIAATLDHCHVPGRDESEHAAALAADTVELGTGPHNEPGKEKLSPQPSPEEFVRRILKYCLAKDDPLRSYVDFGEGDETVLMVSNFGGISYLEMGALVDELLGQLEEEWKIVPARVYWGQIETSLNAPAFSVSVANVSKSATEVYKTEDILGFFDAKTTTHWESMSGLQSGSHSFKTRRSRKEQTMVEASKAEVEEEKERTKPIPEEQDVKVDPAVLDRMLRSACAAVIAAEPDITKWDTVMGDGDCGETLKTGATALLEALDDKGIAKSGSVIEVLRELEDIVESRMGGTLGGILGVFFVALRAAVQTNAAELRQDLPALWAKSLMAAITDLGRYTPAKVGDRTVMDTLLVFAEGMGKEGGGFEGAVAEAVKGAENTRAMRPKLGRATYVGVEDTQGLLPPDPGAWGAMVAIQGLGAVL